MVRVVEVPGAKLFLPKDHPQALTVPLRAFLGSAPPGCLEPAGWSGVILAAWVEATAARGGRFLHRHRHSISGCTRLPVTAPE